MKKIFLLIIGAAAFANARAQTDTKRITVYDGKFSIAIPADMDTMSAAYIQVKYHKTPDGRSYYYGDKEALFSLVITVLQDATKEEDMVKHKEELFNSYKAKGYKLEESTVRKVGGHNIILLSFYSDVPGGKVFNRRFFAVAGGKLLLVTFNAFGADEEKRKLQIEQSINSVVIK